MYFYRVYLSYARWNIAANSNIHEFNNPHFEEVCDINRPEKENGKHSATITPIKFYKAYF